VAIVAAFMAVAASLPQRPHSTTNAPWTLPHRA